MSRCTRPLDPLDAEAVAAQEAPVYASDAADHARLCADCALAVSEAVRLSADLDDLSGRSAEDRPAADATAPGLADSVMRLRPFSPRESRDFRLWKSPCLFAAVLFLSGLVTLTLPGITAREQAGLAVAALAPLAALPRAAGRLLLDLAVASPAGVEALGEVLRRQQALGLASLLLLAPVLWGLTRALARERRR